MGMAIMQSSLNKGEISLNLQARKDLALWGSALRTCKNFWVKAQGGADNRPGTRYKGPAKAKCVLIPFQYNTSQAYMIECGAGYFRFYSQDGIVLKNSVIYEVANSFSEADLENIYYHQSADVIYMACGRSVWPKELTRYANDDWRLSDYQFKDGPFLAQNTEESKSILVSYFNGAYVLTANEDIFKTAPELFKIRQKIPTGVISETITATKTTEAFVCNNQYTLFTSNTWAGTIAVEYSTDKIIWEEVRKVASQNNQNFDIYGELPEELCWVRLKITLTSGSLTYNFSVKNDPFYFIFKTYEVSQIGQVAKATLETPLGGASELFPGQSAGDAELIPTMTSNTNPSGTASTNTSSADAWKAFGGWTKKINLTGITIVSYEWASYVFINGIYFTLSSLVRQTGRITVTDENGNVLYVFTKTEASTSFLASAIIPYTKIKKINIVFAPDTTFNETSLQEVQVYGYNDADFAKGQKDWARGAFSPAEGFPQAVDIFQSRVCWAKDISNYATQIEDYHSFKRSAELVDSDGVSTTLLSLNRINALAGLKRLLAFTNDGTYATDGNAFTPTNFGMPKANSFGGAAIKPVVAGARVIYAQRLGTGLRDIAYDLASDSVSGDSLILTATHLFENKKIKKIAYLQEPNSLIFVLFNDGSMAICTYLREQEVLAWSRFETDGTIEDIASLTTESYDELWLVVNRNGTRFIEKMENRMISKALKDQFFIDSGVTQSLETATRTMSGLTHLAGRTVNALADGVVVRGLTVSAEGTITLPESIPSAKIIHAGLPYSCELETLPLIVDGASGSLAAVKKRITSVAVKVMDSKGGRIGSRVPQEAGYDADTFGDTTYEIEERPLVDTLFSGIRRVECGGVNHEEATAVIQQTDPLPLSVTAIIPTVEAGR